MYVNIVCNPHLYFWENSGTLNPEDNDDDQYHSLDAQRVQRYHDLDHLYPITARRVYVVLCRIC